MNVLIFPAGTEIGREIWQALRHCKDLTLLLAGTDSDNHARYYARPYYPLPDVNQPDWLTALNRLIAQQQIDVIFPAHDEVLLALAEAQEKIPARVLAPSLESCRITRSKRATYAALAGVVSLPLIYSPDAIPQWPVFVKPDRGQGAQGAARIDSATELHLHLARLTDPLICEYLPGEEVTVDCFSDREQGLLFCQPRSRERIRNGIAMASQPLTLPGVREMAQKIAARLAMTGAWFFQLKGNAAGELTLLEVAPRIAGTMALNRVSGINFPLLTLYEQLRLPLSLLPPLPVQRISRGLVNRYQHPLHYQHLYIDFDDTLWLHGALCVPLMALLFQSLNEGKQLHLITRHRHDIYSRLRNLRIDTLFDSISHLRQGENKSHFITQRDAIFIDDSFSERQEVFQALGIATFDLSMIELLIKE